MAGIEQDRVEPAKAQIAAAERQAADEREKTREAEQAAAQHREAAEEAERLRFGSERRAQGLQGQLDQAVMLADNRGRENKGLRADKKRLQAEVSELRAQLPAGQHKAIVTPFVRERRGSTKRETRPALNANFRRRKPSNKGDSRRSSLNMRHRGQT